MGEIHIVLKLLLFAKKKSHDFATSASPARASARVAKDFPPVADYTVQPSQPRGFATAE